MRTLVMLLLCSSMSSCLVDSGEKSSEVGQARRMDENTDKEGRVLERLCNNSTRYQGWASGREYSFAHSGKTPPSYMHAYKWSHPNFISGNHHMDKVSRASTMKRMLGIPVRGESIGLTEIVPIEGGFHVWDNGRSGTRKKTVWIDSRAVTWLDKWHRLGKVSCVSFENEFPIIEYGLGTAREQEIVADKDDRTWFLVGLEDGSMTMINTKNRQNTCYLNGERYVCRNAQLLRFDDSGRPHGDFFLKDKEKTKDNYRIITGKWYDHEG